MMTGFYYHQNDSWHCWILYAPWFYKVQMLEKQVGSLQGPLYPPFRWTLSYNKDLDNLELPYKSLVMICIEKFIELWTKQKQTGDSSLLQSKGTIYINSLRIICRRILTIQYCKLKSFLYSYSFTGYCLLLNSLHM